MLIDTVSMDPERAERVTVLCASACKYITSLRASSCLTRFLCLQVPACAMRTAHVWWTCLVVLLGEGPMIAEVEGQTEAARKNGGVLDFSFEKSLMQIVWSRH